MTDKHMLARRAFYRTIIVSPSESAVSAWVEDDFHHMGVTLEHDGKVIHKAKAEQPRAPWTTCPGSVQMLEGTFTGAQLADARRMGAKKLNCTHLHDMATLAANHWDDAQLSLIEIRVTDAVEGERIATLHWNGEEKLRFVEQNGNLLEPKAVAGSNLFGLNAWIASLTAEAQEIARLLRWATILAHGRTIPVSEQSNAEKIPPNCFTFQPGQREHAVRVGLIRDFNDGEVPLAELLA